MRQKTISVYSFDELSEDAKKKAISNFSYLEYEWWESVYEDAGNIGLKITVFDLDRNKHVKGELHYSMIKCIDKILSEHGKSTNTYQLALSYCEKWDNLVVTYSDGEDTSVVAEGNVYDFDQEADELERDFLIDLCEEYASILQNEYEYLTSEECIRESIKANGYEFDEHGNMI